MMFRHHVQIRRSARLFSGVVSQTSVLSNGIRVNSIEIRAAQSFVSACVHAGSRHESDATSGSLRFLERIFYLSSAQKSTKQMLQSMAALGGNVTSTVQRECTLYTVELNPQQPQALLESARLLADMTLHPKFDLIEVESTKEQEVSELASLVQSIPLLADDLTHMTAFGKYTLGRPLLITPEVLHKLSAVSIRDAHRTWFQPNRMVLTAVNPPGGHQNFVSTIESHFGSAKPAVLDDRLNRAIQSATKSAVYQGGESRLAATGLPLFRTIFQGPSWQNRSASIAAVVLNNMLDINGVTAPSTSLRFPQLIARSNSRIGMCQPLLLQYSDAGLLGFQYSCHPSLAFDALKSIIRQYQSLTDVGAAEFEVARAATRALIQSRYEQPGFLVTELGYRSLFSDGSIPVMDCDADLAMLDNINVGDIRELIASTLKQSDCSFLCLGPNLQQAPALFEIRDWLRAL